MASYCGYGPLFQISGSVLSYLDKALSDNDKLLRAEGCKDTKKTN